MNGLTKKHRPPSSLAQWSDLLQSNSEQLDQYYAISNAMWLFRNSSNLDVQHISLISYSIIEAGRLI